MRMRRIFIIIAVLFLLVAAMPLKAQTLYSSGLTTSDRLIATGNCYYYGMSVVSGASTAVVVIYDALTISGTTVDKASCPTSSGSCVRFISIGAEVFNGIYADVTGTGAAYTVFYKCK